MATYFQQNDNVISHLEVGESGSVKYTIVVGQPVFIGADADGNAGRVVPVTDISAHKADGLAMTATADTDYSDDKMSVAIFPCRVLTDSVKAATPPEATADSKVYIEDDGTFSDTDGGSAGHSYGDCLEVKTSGKYTGLYLLNLTGMDET